MSDLPFQSAVTNVWPRTAGSTTTAPSATGPVPLGSYSPAGLPTVNNPNLPPSTIRSTGNFAPPVPRPPLTPFPSIRQPFGTNSTNTNVYAPNQPVPPFTQFPSIRQPFDRNAYAPNQPVPPFTQFPSIRQPFDTNIYAANQPMAPYNQIPPNVVQNSVQNLQNLANNRRLVQLEDENTKRRNTTSTLQQMGTHLLQGQMDVQEQVLQYQFMLEQCMETLDHQNFIVNGQAEELSLLRAKMRHFEYLMDCIQHNKESDHRKNTSLDPNLIDTNALCSRKLVSLYGQNGSPFFPGGVTRVTSSKFQPFNPRYRSPNGRSPNQNESRSMTPSIQNSAAANTRLSRPISNMNH